MKANIDDCFKWNNCYFLQRQNDVLMVNKDTLLITSHSVDYLYDFENTHMNSINYDGTKPEKCNFDTFKDTLNWIILELDIINEKFVK
jgi:hypothetical protein